MLSWKHFGYVVAYSFTYTMVLADVFRNVPIIKYLHLSTITHTFVAFYWMHCTYNIHAKTTIV